MADPYGNYLANLSPFAGPGLAPMGMTPEQAALYGMPKAPEAMDPGLSSLVGHVGAELGLEGLQNMADLGHGIDPKYNSLGLDVGPKAAQAMGSLGAGAMRGMIFAKPGAAGALGGRLMTSWSDKLETTANKMEKAGLPDDAIYDATKLFKTADGQWKREIPDLAGSMRPQALDALHELYNNPNKTGRVAGKLSDFIDHPPLFYEYPESKNIPTAMRLMPGDSYSGSYGFSKPGTFQGTKIITDTGIQHPDRGPQSLFGVTMHEVNHAIANREGFASGSSPEAELNNLTSVLNKTRKMYEDELNSPSPDYEKVKRLNNMLFELQTADPYQTYLRSAGEVDSRAVQQRLNMTAPELNAISPRTTVNNLVPLWNQIVRPFGAESYNAAGLDRIGKTYNPTSPRDYYVKQGDKFVNSTSHTWDDYTHRYNPSTGVMEPIQMTPEGKFVITGPGERP
jgi:hypothetical protein